MEMKRLTGGNLRAAGYDDRRRVLVVELTSGTFEYTGVSADTFRRLATASSPAAMPATPARRTARGGRADRACRRGAPSRHWIESFRPVCAAFRASVSSSTPFSNFAALAASSSSTGSVKLR